MSTSGVAQGLMGDLKRGVDIYTGSRLGRIKESFIREAIEELVATDEFAFGKGKRTG
jgi:hypothetical protein